LRFGRVSPNSGVESPQIVGLTTFDFGTSSNVPVPVDRAGAYGVAQHDELRRFAPTAIPAHVER
jgi:hypothetical protein